LSFSIGQNQLWPGLWSKMTDHNGPFGPNGSGFITLPWSAITEYRPLWEECDFGHGSTLMLSYCHLKAVCMEHSPHWGQDTLEEGPR
jgi:hypothetical protein